MRGLFGAEWGKKNLIAAMRGVSVWEMVFLVFGARKDEKRLGGICVGPGGRSSEMTGFGWLYECLFLRWGWGC
jgi:hypothetical protein